MNNECPSPQQTPTRHERSGGMNTLVVLIQRLGRSS
jgi:hypothetical protein